VELALKNVLLVVGISVIAAAIWFAYRGPGADPEGISRRPPYSMHAHQQEWPDECLPGRRSLQSPISLTTTHLAELRESPIQLTLLESKADLLDVGHTFQVRFGSKAPGATAQFEGQRFALRQFHFHKPSEHLIDGKQYEMEAHFVFMNENASAPLKAFVIGVMMIDGPSNAEIGKIWKYLPPPREGYGESKVEMSDWKAAASTRELEVESQAHNERVLGKAIAFDLAGILPREADLVIYDGSLTTPTCDEGITHAISLTPVYMEHEQVEHFEGYYEGSNRDLQVIGDPTHRNFRRASYKRP
jgi:carbonic anhydrase